MVEARTILVLLMAAALVVNCQSSSANQSKPASSESAPAAAEDISGMYSFLNNGEFMQINMEGNSVSGYVSRMGDLESDRGTFLDQFFDKASIQGHDVAFTTKVLHGEWFEFKGRFDRGRVKTKAEDGYYILRGTLTEFSNGEDEKNPAARAHQVEFKWLAQPQDVEEKKPKSKAR
jgi:hypothetical protein